MSDTQGEHIIYGGAGLDRIIVSKNDTAFGSLGDDTFEALENSENNILHGDEGNDTFLLSKNNQALGGQGRDRFFMQGEGKNLVWGGQDIDEFWIADQDFPSSFNAIMDFELGVDTIGLKGFAGREMEIMEDEDTTVAIPMLSVTAVAVLVRKVLAIKLGMEVLVVLVAVLRAMVQGF